MNKGRVIRVLSFLLIMVMMLSACSKNSSTNMNASDTSSGSAKDGMEQEYPAADVDYGSTTDASGGITEPEYDATESAAGNAVNGEEDIANSSALTTGDLQAGSQDKIIKNYYLEVETQDFDKLIKNINKQIKSLGGYVESSTIGGKSYYESNVTRSGSIVARIPAIKCDEFVNTVDKTANVTSNQSSTKNVTLDYVAAESKIDTLKIEQDRLYKILEKADSLDSIITLESRLSEIRFELENYESQLRVYDNQVQYSTVTMNIQEVERITPDTKEKPTFASRIHNGFSDTLYHISEGSKNFLVWFIVNLPYLLIWGIIILVVILVVRRFIRKAGQKKPLTNSASGFDMLNEMQDKDASLDQKDVHN